MNKKGILILLFIFIIIITKVDYIAVSDIEELIFMLTDSPVSPCTHLRRFLSLPVS